MTFCMGCADCLRNARFNDPADGRIAREGARRRRRCLLRPSVQSNSPLVTRRRPSNSPNYPRRREGTHGYQRDVPPLRCWMGASTSASDGGPVYAGSLRAAMLLTLASDGGRWAAGEAGGVREVEEVTSASHFARSSATILARYASGSLPMSRCIRQVSIWRISQPYGCGWE